MFTKIRQSIGKMKWKVFFDRTTSILVGLFLGLAIGLYYTSQKYIDHVVNSIFDHSFWFGLAFFILIIFAVIALVVYTSYRSQDKVCTVDEFVDTVDQIAQDPKQLLNPNFHTNELRPKIASGIKLYFSWLAFSRSFASLLLIAGAAGGFLTVAIMILQVERLAEQNRLIDTQTTDQKVVHSNAFDIAQYKKRYLETVKKPHR